MVQKEVLLFIKQNQKRFYAQVFCRQTFKFKMYELGGRRFFGKIGLEVKDASRKNSTPMRDSKGSVAYYKTESKAFLCSGFLPPDFQIQIQIILYFSQSKYIGNMDTDFQTWVLYTFYSVSR